MRACGSTNEVTSQDVSQLLLQWARPSLFLASLRPIFGGTRGRLTRCQAPRAGNEADTAFWAAAGSNMAPLSPFGLVWQWMLCTQYITKYPQGRRCPQVRRVQVWSARYFAPLTSNPRAHSLRPRTAMTASCVATPRLGGRRYDPLDPQQPTCDQQHGNSDCLIRCPWMP